MLAKGKLHIDIETNFISNAKKSPLTLLLPICTLKEVSVVILVSLSFKLLFQNGGCIRARIEYVVVMSIK